MEIITYVLPNISGNTLFKQFYDPSEAVVDNNWTNIVNYRQLLDGTPVLYPQKWKVLQLGGTLTNPKMLAGYVLAGPLGELPQLPVNMQTATTEIALTNGANNNVAGLAIAPSVFVRLVGPTGVFNITGISGGIDGYRLILYNSTSENMTITDNSGSSTAGNKILTGSAIGGDITLHGQGCVELVYDIGQGAWIYVSGTANPA